MSRMIRKQVYLERRQDEILKQESARTGVTESELIRRAVERLADSRRPEAGRTLGEASRGRDERDVVGDPQCWAEALELMDRIAERTKGWRKGREGRGWAREEIYDERLGRVSR